MADMSSKATPKRVRTRGAALLEKWRASLKLTQQAACALVALDPATYCAFESGRKTPGLKRAAKIATGTIGRVPIESWVPSDRGS